MRPLAVCLILAAAVACICAAAPATAEDASPGSRAALDANAQGLAIVEGASPNFALAAEHFHRAYSLSWTRIKALRRTLRSARAEVAQAREDAAEDPSEPLTAAEEAALQLLKKQVQQSKLAIHAERKMAAEYLNNEAVSYMRLQKMNDAKRVLDQALTLSPHVDALSNLKHVEEYLRNTAPKSKAASNKQEEDDEEEEDEEEEEEEEEAPRKKKRKAKANKKTKPKQAQKKKKQKQTKQRKRNDDDDEEEDDEAQESDEEEEEEEPKRKKKKKQSKKKKKKKTKQVASSSSNDTATSAAPARPPRPAMDRPRRPNRTHRDPLPRIHLAHWDWEENREYALGRKPFILVGALDRWNLSVWSPRALASLWPSTLVDFYPHNMEKASVRPFMVNMSTAISEQARPSGKFPHSPTHGGAYIQWNVKAPEWEEIMRVHAQPPLPALMRKDDAFLMPPALGGLGDGTLGCLSSAKLKNEFAVLTHWRMVLVGNRGAGMFNHQDVLRTASFQAQVVGSKRWHVCAPDQSRFLYAPGTLDTFDPDYDRYPLYAQARCYEDVVGPGEVVFYPADYWHQTENVASPTIAMSATVMDANNWELIAGELEAECANQKYKWGFSDELCVNLRGQCFPFWRQHFKQGGLGNNDYPTTQTAGAVKDEL